MAKQREKNSGGISIENMTSNCLNSLPFA